jgi:hypothetical protein
MDISIKTCNNVKNYSPKKQNMQPLSYLPVTEQGQLEFFLAGMYPVERNSILEYFKFRPRFEPTNDYAPGLLLELSRAIENIFLATFLFEDGRKFGGTLPAFEKLINFCSPQFLWFIRKLDLGSCGLPFVPSPGIWNQLPYNIGKLVNLRYLYLNGQPIEDLSPLAPLQLNFICLEACRVTDVSPLNFKRLGWLNMRQTPIHDLSHIIKHGNSLGIIPLEDTPIKDPDQIVGLTKLDSSTTLWLNGTSVAKELPNIIGFFERKNHPFEQFIISDPTELKRKNDNMLRPTHYMGTDDLDLVAELPVTN